MMLDQFWQLSDLIARSLANPNLNDLFYNFLSAAVASHLVGEFALFYMDGRAGVRAKITKQTVIEIFLTSFFHKNNAVVHVFAFIFFPILAWTVTTNIIGSDGVRDAQRQVAWTPVFYGVLVIGEIILRKWQVSMRSGPTVGLGGVTPSGGGPGPAASKTPWKDFTQRAAESAAGGGLVEILKAILGHLHESANRIETVASQLKAAENSAERKYLHPDTKELQDEIQVLQKKIDSMLQKIEQLGNTLPAASDSNIISFLNKGSALRPQFRRFGKSKGYWSREG